MSADEDPIEDGAPSPDPTQNPPLTEGEDAVLGDAEEPERVADEAEEGETAPEPAAAEPSAFRYDDAFYQPVSGDAPAGAAIEFYHFAEMEQDLAWPTNEFGRPDPAQRPNFRAVKDAALGFLKGSKEFGATRDVRPMLALAIAEAGDKGPVGLAKALDLFVTITMRDWPTVHPQKEDEDDDEYMTRMEEMRKFMNPQIFSLAVDTVGIARSPRVGDLTTRTFGIAAGKITAREGEFAPNVEALTALLGDEEEAAVAVAQAHDAYRHANDRLLELEAFLAEHPDVDPVDLASVAAALSVQAAYLAPFLGQDAGGGDPADAATDADGSDGAASMASPSAPIDGPKTLAEAMALMDEVLVFYAQNARSSPVPLGLIALRDLSTGDFNTWLSQTAPAGLEEAALNIAAVDASRLDAFASGDVAAVAPVPAAEMDFSLIDPSLGGLEGAYAALDTAIYEVQKRIRLLEDEPAEGEEPEEPLAAEIAALRSAIDAVQDGRTAMEEGDAVAASDPSGSENNAGGDARHSRITDRTGVKVALDAIAAYFEREEPSSPAPAYLRRLKSFVDARFTEIARELMPEDGGEAKLRLEPRKNLR